MRFGILGTTQAWHADGRPAATGGPRLRALLALLLVDAGQVVTADRLIDGLYGYGPPAGVTNALQSQVSRLRSLLGDSALVELHPAGYRLAVDPGDVDAHRFTRLAAAGRTALNRGNAQLAAELLREALQLWRGPALADVGDVPFARAQAARLEELRVTAVEDRIQAELDLGQHRDLVAELQELVAAWPLRERLRGQLMRALAGAGRQAEALTVFEDARRALADELGADPSPELAAIHLAILRSETTGPVAASGSQRRALPAQLTSFVGRTGDLERVGALLGEARLITLTGPGGAGKTRLAIEAAGRATGEVCFVELAPIGDAAHVPIAVLSALGLRDDLLVAPDLSRPGPDSTERLVAALADRELLLVLDNCEHVVAAAAQVAHRLLSASPTLRILATSREALGITGERLCAVPPLPLPPSGTVPTDARSYPAVQLFADRAAAVHPGFAVDTGNAETVLRICRALDGLPLAIELAAARLTSLPLTEIATRLDDRFRLLSRGERTADPRHQTLRAVVEWSWDLLAEREKALARRLTVFAGGATLEAAERVCALPAAASPAEQPAAASPAEQPAAASPAEQSAAASPAEQSAAPGHIELPAAEVLDALTGLAEKSFITVDDDGRRYRMLETVRAFCAERLAEAGEAELLRRAHAAYFLDLALTADAHIRRAEQLEWLSRLDAERDNLHEALRRAIAADQETALRLLGAVTMSWWLRGLRREATALATALLEAVGPDAPPGLEEEHTICVLTVGSTGLHADELKRLLAQANPIIYAEERQLRYPFVVVLWAMSSGPPEDGVAAEIMEQRLPLGDDPWLEACAYFGRGYTLMYSGDQDTAEADLADALRIFRALGERWGMGMVLSALAEFADWRGDRARAVALTAEALELAEQLGSVDDQAELLSRRADRLLQVGDVAGARADYQRSTELARVAGAPEKVAAARLGLARLALLGGDLAAARRLCEEALAVCPVGWFGADAVRAGILVLLGQINESDGDLAEAAGRFREALTLTHRTIGAVDAAGAAAGLAAVAQREGDGKRAALLLGAATALRPGAAGDDAYAERVAAAARSQIGDAAYRWAYEKGAGMTRDQALTAIGAPPSASGA